MTLPMRLLFALLACAAFAAADTLALKDGRFVDGRPIEKTDDGYRVEFEHGSVVVPGRLVLFHVQEGAEPEEFVPLTDLEKKKHEQGFVPWKGRWVRKSYWERLWKKEYEGRLERMEQMKARRLWRNHVTVETRRFVFKHTLPDAVFEEFKDLFETYYDFFTDYWRVRPSSKFGKVTINIYHDRDYFHQVSGAPPGVIGYYAPLERDLHFYYDRENHRFTIDVMFHEGNHMLTHMINERMWYPWWIGEGMAEYFGASEWDPEDKTMSLGHLQSGRLAVLHSQIRDEKWLKLEDLLGADRMGAVEYAWTWSFCHFLLHTPEYEKRFKRYFLAIGKDKRLKRVGHLGTMFQLPRSERVESFKKYLRVDDLEELQTEWYRYIKENLSLDRADVDWGLAGYIMSVYGEQAKARYFFKKAIDAGSKDAYVHYGYAKLKLQQHMEEIAEKYARKAVEYDPMHAQAWSILGVALRKGGQKEEGLRLLELAHEMDPEDPQIWLQLDLAKQEDRGE